MNAHLDPETIAAFAEGRLDAPARDAVVAHLDRCEDCLGDAAVVMPEAGAEAERRRFRRPAWLLAVAAAILLAIVLPQARNALWHRSPVDALVAAAPPSARVVEPRLTGGFSWAAYKGPMRASGPVSDAARWKLNGAAAAVIDRANHDRADAAQHAAGVALILVEKPEEAAAQLAATAQASNDPKTWSDLAAARYAAAVQYGRSSLYPMALAAADKALESEPRLPEALFNRALIVQQLGLTIEARRAWERYLDVDSTSPWAKEAREHLAELPATTGSSRFERDQPLLEHAAAANDIARVRRLVDAHRERFRALAEAEYLGRWAEAEQRHDDLEASRWLTVARSIGDALQQLSGESLLCDAVQTIGNADPPARASLAEAHTTYRRGRIAHSRREAASAQRDLRRAAELFGAAGDPMALMARHYAASARLALDDLAGARAELTQLRADASAHPTYLSLGAHVRWELARALMSDEDWAGQVSALTEGAELFGRAGERSSQSVLESMLAGSLSFLGREDEAWNARIRSFRALSDDAQPETLAAGVGSTVRTELWAGRLDGALALTRVVDSLQRGGAEPIPAIENLNRRAMLESVTGDDATAALTLQRTGALVSRLSDAEVRGRQMADVEIVRGAQLLDHDPRGAAAALTKAIDFHRARNRFTDLPEPLLLRARSAMRLGQIANAERDLEDGVEAVERHPLQVERAVLGTGVLDAGRKLFAEAIRLRLDRGDVAGAFAYAERSRGGALMTIDALKRQLAGSDTVVLDVVSLPDEVVTWAVSANDAMAVRRPRGAAELASLAEACAAGDHHASAALYDDLVRPADRLVALAGMVIIVPDPSLAGVPFAALFDSATKRYLVENMSVAIASSAASLQPPPHGVSTSMAGIVLPAPEQSARLPEAESEIGEIAALYRQAAKIPAERATWAALESAAATADVVHLAGHTERQQGEEGQALLFAGSGSATERVSWKSIVASPALRARVIVLAACETLRPPRSADTRALSLGAAFAAGGADVIGTLTPIADGDARTLFRAVHRELAAGARPAAALRAVQVEAIRKQESGGTARAWRALAVLTRHVS
jgi:tetratricopeptide (TPR) repeat protein